MNYVHNSLIRFISSLPTANNVNNKNEYFNFLSLISFINANYRIPLNTSLLFVIVFPGEPGSHVFGSISDGVFHGKIISPRGGAWYVEKAYYYFPPHEINDTLHSVIYHENNVDDPYAHLRKGNLRRIVSFSFLFFSFRFLSSSNFIVSNTKRWENR